MAIQAAIPTRRRNRRQGLYLGNTSSLASHNVCRPQVESTLATFHDSCEVTMAGTATPGADPRLDKVRRHMGRSIPMQCPSWCVFLHQPLYLHQAGASHALQAMAWFLKLITEHATQHLSQPLRQTIVSLHDNALLVLACPLSAFT